MTRKHTARPAKEGGKPRAERLGFRLDAHAKRLIERAANLEHRKLTDFCVAALTDAARHTIARHEALLLSEQDRAVFFNVLMNPPRPNKKLKRAFEAERRRGT